jgi:ribonuclease R
MSPKHKKMKSSREKVFENLLRVTYEYIKGKHYIPITRTSLIDKLRILPEHLAIFDRVLKSLRAEGKVRVAEEKYHIPYELNPGEKCFRGQLKVHPRGFGFVEVSGEDVPDIFIPKPYIGIAIDGDVVDCIVDTTAISKKGPEGKIITIVERERKTLVGIVTRIEQNKAYCFSFLLGEKSFAVLDLSDLGESNGIEEGDRLLLDVIEWGTTKEPTKVSIKERLGSIDDASKDTIVALFEHEIRQDFPTEVLEQAVTFGSKVNPKEFEDRVDLRDSECFTIDPDTAKDYDDAISLKRTKNGYELGVHIADVAHYVEPGSPLDHEARLRGNSTYLPGLCVPMLPSSLSNELCSLKEGVCRLVVSVFMNYDKTGAMHDYKIVRSVIKSQKRFTYKMAKQVLDGTLKSKHKDTLDLCVELCGLLKKRRKERGSVELYLPEFVIKLDDHGEPIGVEILPYDITHQLIEEFMLQANETVARSLQSRGKELAWRVHEEPAKESIREFSSLAHAFGYKIAPNPTAQDIQKFFASIEEDPFSQYLATFYIRSMRLACYSVDNIGHYGLSLEHYCHFTSPIRRYVDLIAQRLLFETTYDKETLHHIATSASERERISAKAESSVLYLKKLRLLKKMAEKEHRRQFEAVLTRVKHYGIYFDMLDLLFEGFLHISELENDYFIFDENRLLLVGRHKGATYRAGDSLSVMVKYVDLIAREAGFELVCHHKKTPEKKEKSV